MLRCIWCMRTQSTDIYLHRNYNQKVRRGELLYLTKVRKPILMKHSNIRIETVAWLRAADTATASEWGSIILPSFPWDPASLGSSATFAFTYIELQTNHRQRPRAFRGWKCLLALSHLLRHYAKLVGGFLRDCQNFADGSFAALHANHAHPSNSVHPIHSALGTNDQLESR